MATDPSHLQREYIEMNRDFSLEIIKYITIFLLLIMINDTVISLIHHQILPVIFMMCVIVAASLALKAIWSKRRGIDTGVTIFCGLVYMGAVIFNAVDDRYFRNPLAAYYMSSSHGIFERILAEGISNIHHRISFNIFALVLRLATTPYNDIAANATHIAMVSISIFVTKYRERRNQHFFYSYYKSTEQLSKFKDLVVQHIPEAITIISQDLTKSLFVNNAFLTLVNPDFSMQKQLEQFLVTEDMENSGSKSHESTPPNSPAFKKTLLDVLRSSSYLERQSYMVKSLNNIARSPGGQEIEKEQQMLFQARIMPITWEEEPCLAIIMHDITQHHTILSLKIADTQKDRVLATVSHELKTPLNGMLGMIQIMEKKIKDAELLTFLTICKTSTNLLVSLVSSILDLNQIKANKIQLNLEKIDVRELLKNIISLFEYQCRHKGIQLKAMVGPGTPRFLTTDRDRLSQVLINLVGNAQKFTSKGEIVVSAAWADNDSVKFSVEDTGIGISEEEKTKLFQVYGRLDHGSEKISSQGVGLGLTIAESLVKVLNENKKSKVREIDVESELGKGSTFSFKIKNRLLIKPAPVESQLSHHEYDSNMTLPTVPSEEEDMKGQARSSPSRMMDTVASPIRGLSINRQLSSWTDKLSLEGSQVKFAGSIFQSRNLGNKQSVLIVDDNLFNIAVAENLVASHGYLVKTALSGQDAIDLVAQNNHGLNPILLILMDCQMPIMDGYETTRILRKMMHAKSVPEIPIVALTANDSEKDKEACRKAGMCDHLSKPLKETELVKIFKKYC